MIFFLKHALTLTIQQLEQKLLNSLTKVTTQTSGNVGEFMKLYSSVLLMSHIQMMKHDSQ